MCFRFLFVPAILLCPVLFGQSAPQLAVDVNANRHAISPDIYGTNNYANQGVGNFMHIPVLRNGGDGTNRYNYLLDTWNHASDYYFESIPDKVSTKLPDGSAFDLFVEQGLTTGSKRIGTTSLLEWLPKSESFLCSYSVARYGPQQMTDQYNPDCGNGFTPDGKTQIVNDPSDTAEQFDQTFQAQWIKYVVSKYGSGTRGGVNIWSLDNEPEWWSSVHMDVHPKASSYDEIWTKGMTYALAIKQTDPTALVTGYVPGGWSGMLYSRVDMNSGWDTDSPGHPYQFYNNPIDQNAHGGIPLVEWYLQQMAAYEAQHGLRLLDYVDVHAYIEPAAVGNNDIDAATDQLRMTSTRVFWDPNYVTPDNTTPDLAHPEGDPPQLVPRMLQWVANNYPGTKTAITEYNWGALNEISGGIAQADILGIFGREGLDLATIWGPPNPASGSKPPDPAFFAFQLYLNYDGMGNQFGETSVSATTTNPDNVSIFAAQRSDYALTVVVLNKMTSAVTAPIAIANFEAAGNAQVYQFTTANPSSIQHLADIPVSGGQVSAKFPALSMTLFVLPASPDSLPVPKPVIGGVASGASYNTKAVSPGEILYIAGQNFGPAALTTSQIAADGYLAQSLAGVRVLVNGIASPMVYQSGTQVSAVVPYYTGLATSAAVQVEVQGVRSDPFPIPVTAAVPALFTHDASGKGQGAILNQDLSLNSAANPAARGQVVVLYGTGEGQTTPPGVDGRLATDILPIPQGACSVMIGGQTAAVKYCGAAPDYTSGLVQINAVVPSNIATGNVPVTFAIGGVASNANVTVAVK
jgi:uncharacterized protein (TIGR03437 family)